MEIIDMICAKYGAIIGEGQDDFSEAFVNRTLGVLQENGIYALFLYLKSQGKGKNEDCASHIQNQLFDLLKQLLNNFKGTSGPQNDIPKIIRDELVEDLNALFFARDLIERTLVYARYHLKVREK